jgi:hypothetical protein
MNKKEDNGMIIKYELVRLQRSIKGICLVCGKKRQVTIYSEQTINPFNLNENGEPKSRREVWDSCAIDLKKLVQRYIEKFICKACLANYKKWFDKTEKEYCNTH